MKYSLEIPINSVSFGQIAMTNILYPAFIAGHTPNIFPIGPIDIKSYTYLSKDFTSWLESCIKKANLEHEKDTPTLKLWHLNEGTKSYSSNTVLFTFHETDLATPDEAHIAKNYKKVLVTSNYTKNVFEAAGCENFSVIKPGFDTNSFSVKNKKYFNDGVISFGLAGKLEQRKRHPDILKFWVQKYGNNRQFVLNCAIANRHLSEDVHRNVIMQAFEGKNYFNVNFNPFMDNEKAYNDYLNSNHIILGMSAAEGFGLPEFQSVALGKHSVVLDATGYKEWATEENSCLVQPSGKSDCYDGVFFQKGAPFNQGQFYNWEKEGFYNGMDRALNRFAKNHINNAGLELQKSFSSDGCFKNIISTLFS